MPSIVVQRIGKFHELLNESTFRRQWVEVDCEIETGTRITWDHNRIKDLDKMRIIGKIVDFCKNPQ